MYKGIKNDLEIAKSWNSKRWNYLSLSWKRLMWILFGKRKNYQWLLPGPTSTSHPYGMVVPHKKEKCHG